MNELCVKVFHIFLKQNVRLLVIFNLHRILVPSDFVGAIIGRKGQTIRNITTQCKARYVSDLGIYRNRLIDLSYQCYFVKHLCTNTSKFIWFFDTIHVMMLTD